VKVAIVVLADNERHEDLGRVVNAMIATRELHEAGEDVKLLFDGGGTVWPGELSRHDHAAHALWESVQDVVTGACSYCADAFDATAGVEQAGVKLLEDYERHPSFLSLLRAGYQVITF